MTLLQRGIHVYTSNFFYSGGESYGLIFAMEMCMESEFAYQKCYGLITDITDSKKLVSLYTNQIVKMLKDTQMDIK
jgi:hypothetical protein